MRHDRRLRHFVGAAALVAAMGAASASPAPAAAQADAGTWASDGATVAPRRDAKAFVLPDGRVVLVGGGVSPTASTEEQTRAANLEQYDPSSSTWSAVERPPTDSGLAWTGTDTAAQLPDGRVFFTDAFLRALLYDGDAWTVVDLPDTDPSFTVPDIASTDTLVLAVEATTTKVLDLATNTVTEVPGPSTRRADDSGSLTRLADGRVVLAGGYSGGHALPDVELYDPTTNAWSEVAPMAEGRAHHSATALADGRLLVIGGFGMTGHLTSAEIYDPTSNQWSAAAPMDAVRDGHRAALLPDGRVLVTGGLGTTGERRHGPLDDVAIYDPAGDTWVDGPPLPAPRWEHALAVTGDRALVIGGRDDTTTEWVPGAVATTTYDVRTAALPANPPAGSPATTGSSGGSGNASASPPATAGSSTSGGGTALAVALVAVAFAAGAGGGFTMVRRRALLTPPHPELRG
jgi:hypothetical protein